MKWTAKAPRDGDLRDRVARLDLRAEDEMDQVFLCVLNDCFQSGNWLDVHRKFVRAWRQHERNKEQGK